MTRLILAILILLTTLFATIGIARSLDPVDELKACAKITARDARYACFDNLGERLLQEEPVDERPMEQPVAQPAAEVTPATVSAQPAPDKKPVQEKVARPEAAVTPAATVAQPPANEVAARSARNEQASREPEFSATITSCRKGHYGDWYFISDDGQVWKEVSRRKLDFDECEFDVTITRDVFGYKMSIEAMGKPIRVKLQK